MAKKEKTGTENLYEDALQSADVIYKLAETTAREGILEELGPNVKRFIAKKIKSESDSAEFDDTDDTDDTDEIEEADESMDDSDKELELDDDIETAETDITVDDTDDEFDINIDDISDEIDLDLSDILNGIDEEPEEPVDESAQIDEEPEEDELDIEALVKEIEAAESDEDEEIEITDESVQIDEENDDEELDLIIIDDEDSVNEETEEPEEDEFEMDELVSENKKLKLALSVLKEKVDEFVLVNKKLKLISNTFALNNFSKKEKMKIIESFDRATTIAESIKVYNTIKKTVNKTKQRRISEGGASKVIAGTKPPKEKPPVIFEHDNKTFKKWARLSGAKNGTFLDD